jgi:polyisoprenoid-binding protein YceI
VPIGLAIAACCCALGAADAGAPGRLAFRGHLPIGDVDGEFHRWRITRAVIDDLHPQRSAVDVEVDLTSLDTANAIRDRHLRSDRFLDVARFPTATVHLRDVQADGDDAFTAQIELDLHGHTQTLPMHFAIVDRAARRVTGAAVLKRTDFGVGTPRGGLFQVGEEVQVTVDVVVPPAGEATHG